MALQRCRHSKAGYCKRNQCQCDGETVPCYDYTPGNKLPIIITEESVENPETGVPVPVPGVDDWLIRRKLEEKGRR